VVGVVDQVDATRIVIARTETISTLNSPAMTLLDCKIPAFSNQNTVHQQRPLGGGGGMVTWVTFLNKVDSAAMVASTIWRSERWAVTLLSRFHAWIQDYKLRGFVSFSRAAQCSA